MFDNKEETAAQFIDRFLQYTTLGVFILALSYASAVAKYFAPSEMEDYFDYAKLGLSLSGAGVVFPFFLKYMRMKKKCNVPSGFVVEMYRKACEYAFAATFILLAFLEPVASEILTDVPAGLYIQLALTVSLLSLSISFYVMGRDDGDMDDEFEGEDA